MGAGRRIGAESIGSVRVDDSGNQLLQAMQYHLYRAKVCNKLGSQDHELQTLSYKRIYENEKTKAGHSWCKFGNKHLLELGHLMVPESWTHCLEPHSILNCAGDGMGNRSARYSPTVLCPIGS